MPTLLTVLAICLAETNLRNVVNRMDGGSPSYGICQMKKSTAVWMDPLATPVKLLDHNFNLETAKKYYVYQLSKYGSEAKAISAYNAGRAITGNTAYVRRVLRQRQRLIAILPLVRQNPNTLFGLFGLKFSEDIKNQLQNAISLNTGDKCQGFRDAQQDGKNQFQLIHTNSLKKRLYLPKRKLVPKPSVHTL